jgi:hypothetical protein
MKGKAGENGARRTEIGNGNNVHHAPDKISRFSLQLDAQRPSGPAPGAVASDHVLGVHDLAGAGVVALPDQIVVLVVGGKIAPEEPVRDLAARQLLRRRRLLLAQRAQPDGDGIGVVVVHAGSINLERLGGHAALDPDRVTGVLLDVVEEEALDAALVQHNLLEARQPDDGVGNAVGPADDAVGAGVPHADLDHVVGLLPRAVAEAEGVKDLEAPALEPVGLAAEDLGVPLVDDAGLDAAVGHPAGRHEPFLRVSGVAYVWDGELTRQGRRR